MEPVKAAHWFARRGYPVFPIWPPEADASCSCKDPDCSSPGKHPLSLLVPHGFKDATTDPQSIDQWWASWWDANVGVRTGWPSGLLVADVDPAKGGLDSVEALEYEHGDVPETLGVATGGDGFHAWFEMPAADIRNSAGLLGPGLDIRANGGYVVAPPSLHVSGKRYRFDPSASLPVLPMPAWMLERLEAKPTASEPKALPALIPEGERNVWMTTLAGAMRRVGSGEGEIVHALLFANDLRCRPPLAAKELTKIAQSMMRYDPETPSRVRVGGKRAGSFDIGDLERMLG